VTQPLRFLTLNKLLAWAAVSVTAAAVVLACSSKSGTPANFEDASTPASDAAASGDDVSDAMAVMSTPCDASIEFATDASAAATECGQCLQEKCASALAACQMTDCTCVSVVECLAVNNNNYTLCPPAIASITAGSVGLTMIGSCILNCPTCNERDN